MKRDDKKKIIKKFAQHDKDTGSAQVQAAVLTTRINQLTEHLKSHKNDLHSRQGLLKMVGKRRRHLQYLKTKSKDEYEKVLDQLQLRK
ncbi:MAG: 30S ribosomal protein S15 [Candidatus Gracilibacteria bacterium]|jgi:small subunit ribosomal protein S15